MSAHRGIATLASALMICFLVLSAMEPEFFLLHFYESLIYLAIVLMLFYFRRTMGLHDWHLGPCCVADPRVRGWLVGRSNAPGLQAGAGAAAY